MKALGITFFADQFGKENDYSVNVQLQEGSVSGKHSWYAHGYSPENNCHSWRKDTKILKLAFALFEIFQRLLA